MAVAFMLREIVARLGGEAVGEVDEPLTGIATLDSAGPREIAFLVNPRYRSRLATTRAGAVILGPGSLSVAHTADESVPVAELVAAARAYARIAVGFCGV